MPDLRTLVDKVTQLTTPWNQGVNDWTYRCATIALLRAQTKDVGAKMFVLGYYAAGDGGGGMYWYDASDTTSADNGGTIIVATDGGRWKLVVTGRVSVKQFGARGNGSSVDLSAIVACYTAVSDAFWPNGTYNLGGSTWTTPPGPIGIYGETRFGVVITRTGSGPIMTVPSGASDYHIENLYFTGTGNTGIISDLTAGPLKGYLIRLDMTNCDFAYEMAAGIDIALIYAVVAKSTFAYIGTVGIKPAAGASTMIAIRCQAASATTNYPNLNRFEDLQVDCGGTSAAVRITGATVLEFCKCDFSVGGMQLDLRDCKQASFSHCWFEGNSNSGAALVRLDGSSISTLTTFEHCNFEGNVCARIFQITSSLPSRLRLHDNTFTKAAGSFILYDNSTTITTLQGDGSVAFWDNTVTGDTVGDKLATWVDFRGGALQPRFSMIVDSSGSGSIIASSDPNAVISRNVAGDVTISNISNPLASDVSKVRAFVTGVTGSEPRCGALSTTSLRIQAYTSAGANVDGIISVIAYGS